MCKENEIIPRSFQEFKYSRYFVYLDYKHQFEIHSKVYTDCGLSEQFSKDANLFKSNFAIDNDDWQNWEDSDPEIIDMPAQSEQAIVPDNLGDNNSAITTEPAMDLVGDITNNEIDVGTTIPDYIYNDKTETTDIKDYLDRFIKLYTFTWNESDAAFSSFIYGYNPLSDWAANASVKRKLQNYAFIRCDLELKIMINASPFYYGEMYISFEPKCGNDVSVTQDTTKCYAMNFSQLPHVRISPQDSKGATFILPYTSNQQFLRLGVANDLAKFGWLRAINYTELRSANGVTGTGATVSIYARPRNLILSGATVELPLQSGTWEERPVSKMASAVAAALGKLGRVPVIGKYATAASMATDGIAKGAYHLGYTNEPNIDNINPKKISSYPPLATTEVSYPFEPLTIDPKNSLSIDQSILGLPDNGDSLSISKLVQRESYFFSTEWATTAASDTLLCSIAVTPSHYRQGTVSDYSVLQGTVTNHVAQCFDYWRGDLIYRFKIVASPFHKGRLRLSFDPSGQSGTNIQNTAGNVGIVYNAIIDIGKTQEVSFRVPYAQYYPWLNRKKMIVDANPTYYNDNTTTSLHDPGYNNGVLTLRVVNALTAPVATAPVTILVSVKGADNLEFASPALDSVTNENNKISFMAPQSRTFVCDDTEDSINDGEEVVIGSPTVFNPSQYLLNHGEVVTNLRQLFHRTYLSTYICGNQDDVVASDKYVVDNFSLPTFPLNFGYTNTTLVSTAARNQANSANVNFSWSSINPITWWMPCFLGHRGGFLWNYHLTAASDKALMVYTRYPKGKFSGNMYDYQRNFYLTSDVDNISKLNYNILFKSTFGAGGSCAIDKQVTPSLSIKAPMYNNRTYVVNNIRSSNFNASENLGDLTVIVPPGVTAPPSYTIDCRVAGAEDFTPIFFLCTPTIHCFNNTVLPPT